MSDVRRQQLDGAQGFDPYTAETDQDDGAPARIVLCAHHHLQPRRRHLLDQYAIEHDIRERGRQIGMQPIPRRVSSLAFLIPTMTPPTSLL